MRTMIFFVVAAMLTCSPGAKASSTPVHSIDNIKTGGNSTANVLGMLDVKTFLLLTPAKVQELTGRKMNFGQKISLKMAQMEIKKQVRKGKTVNLKELGKKVEGGISFLWLLVGFLLGIAGVLIAYVTREGSDDNRVKSAWIGFGISALLIILFYVAFFAIWASAGYTSW